MKVNVILEKRTNILHRIVAEYTEVVLGHFLV